MPEALLDPTARARAANQPRPSDTRSDGVSAAIARVYPAA